jgi:hypothetical protein
MIGGFNCATARPRVFIGSSVASRKYAYEIKESLPSAQFEPVVWNEDDVFPASDYPLPSLLEQTELCDLAIFVMSTDDVTERNGKVTFTTRDNVVFESGLFWGALGRENTFLLVLSDRDLHIPTDLLGLTQLRVEHSPTVNVEDGIREACSRLSARYLSPPNTELSTRLNGFWIQKWTIPKTISKSGHYPETNESTAKVMILGKRFRAWFGVQGQAYQIAATIDRNLITGKWFGPNKAAYYGACQLIVDPTFSRIEGKWVGFRSNFVIETGPWEWVRSSPVDRA